MELDTERVDKRLQVSSRDRKAVLFVAEQGFAMASQIWRVAWSDHQSPVYTRSRLLGLQRLGFLDSLKIESSACKIFRVTQKGRNLVAGISKNLLPTGSLSPSMAVHQLELNEVRIELEARGVSSWRSAESLLIDPTFEKLGGRHVPDGLYLTSKGVRTVVEYDRTMRKKERIKERMSGYLVELMSPNRSFDRLIYLVSPMLERAYKALFEDELISVHDRAVLMTMPDFLNVLRDKKDE